MQDSPIIQCFRQVWQRLSLDSVESQDAAQIDHMIGWLETKLAGYQQPLPYADQLGVVYEAAAWGWGQILEGCLLLSDYWACGEQELLEQARHCSEAGELALQQLEQAIVESRSQKNLVDGYLD
jgi:hypothetical protein